MHMCAVTTLSKVSYYNLNMLCLCLYKVSFSILREVKMIFSFLCLSFYSCNLTKICNINKANYKVFARGRLITSVLFSLGSPSALNDVESVHWAPRVNLG